MADILNKLYGFYGNVSSGETLIQSFYNGYQKDDESIVSYGSRLEQTISRAIRCGHMELSAKDAMLRSKFWTGLKSQELRNSTRHIYDSVKDFQLLLREIRKVEQEESNRNRPVPKQTVVQQQVGQTNADENETNTQLLKQMMELMVRMKSLEQRLDTQQQALDAANNQPSFQQSTSQNQRGQGRGYRGRFHGNFGRGFDNRRTNYQDNNSRGNFWSGRSRGGYRGGTNGRGATRDSSSSGGQQALN